ncbi:MAG: type II secretion system protein [Desulfuromonadales bacterium]|nr:type II secretion system protein [Desulfuromonadales bacterium]
MIFRSSQIGQLRSSQTGQRGAILLLLLVMVSVLGLAASMAGQTWRSTMQQAREAELLFRGQQYQQAVASYYAVKHGPQQMLPAKLEHLLRDPRFPGVVRHLRKLYNDPMTGEDWELVTDPAERIIGVRSSSDLEPFRKDGFPQSLDKLRDKTSYREWEFVFAPTKKQSQKQTTQNPFAKPATESAKP